VRRVNCGLNQRPFFGRPRNIDVRQILFFATQAQMRRYIGSGAISANLVKRGKSMISRIRTGFLAAGAAALLSSQAVYAAPVAPTVGIDPLVAVSALAGTASGTAVCAGSTAAAAAASAAAQGAAPGCVLPVTSPPPVASVAPPVVPVESVGGGGIGTLPLLLGLAAIAGVAAYFLLKDDNDDEDTTPVSPA